MVAWRNRDHRPGARGGEELYWQVTSAGGREHVFVFASPQRVQQFEDSIAMLLRGVGGLAETEPIQAQPGWPGSILTSPLLDTVEAAQGLWARKIVFGTEAGKDDGFARHANHSGIQTAAHLLSSPSITPGSPLIPSRNIFHGSSSDDTCCRD